ncbi:MAG: hypothetical protein RBT81_09735 [Gammaproteobacteria bacterium]|jgi:hypothetical protein|nr:hypothetical protein [Gammaproteobacteria bacterium]
MVALANFILRGRLHALLVTAVAAVLMLLVPLIGIIAGGALALVTLRNGVGEGLLIAVGTAAVLAVAAQVLGGAASTGGIAAALALSWAPLLLGAAVLRSTRSQAAALAAAGLGIAGFALLFHASVGDTAAWWRAFLPDFLQPLLERLPMSEAEQEEFLGAMASAMTGGLAATLLSGTMAALLFGRWLQSLVFNPGGFGAEFRALRLGRMMSVVALLVLALSSLLGGWIGGVTLTLLFLCATMLAVQGLALAHALVTLRGAHVGWLIALYGLLVFFPPQALVVLAAAGFADGWFDLRARTKSGGPPQRS